MRQPARDRVPHHTGRSYVPACLVGLLFVLVSCVAATPSLQPVATPGWAPPSSSYPPQVPVPTADSPQSSSIEGQPAFTLDLETGGQSTRLLVFDNESLLVEARPAGAQEAAAAMEALAEAEIVAVRGRTDDTLIVAWLVTPCDRQAALTLRAPVITVELPPRQGCDAVAIVRAVALRFADPDRVALFRPTLIDARILPEVVPPTPVAPPPTAEG